MRWVGGLLAAALLGALALAWAAANRAELLERVLIAALRQRGIQQASLRVEQFSADRLTLADVVLGDGDLALQRLDVGYSLAGLIERRLGELRVTGLHVRGTLEQGGVRLGALDALRGGGDAPTAVRFPALPMARLEVEDARLELDSPEGPYVATLSVDMDAAGDGRVALAASAFPGRETAMGLDAEPFAVAGRIALRPERAELHLEPAPFQLALARDDGNLRVVGSTPTLVLVAGPDGLASLELAARGGALRLPELGIDLSGIDADASIDAASGLPLARISIEQLRDERKPKRFPPLAFAGSLRPADETLAFEGSFEGLAGRLKLAVTGAHDPAAGGGRADLALAPLRVGKGGVAPRDLAPASGALLLSASGNLVATGKLAWGAEQVSGFLDLGLRDLALKTTGASIEHLNAAARVDGPWPPRIPRGQLVSMARLDFGLELTDGLIDYGVRRDGVVEVESATWRFAGGTLRTQGALDLAADRHEIELDVSDVELEKLLALVNLDGLTGTGKLSGRLPVVVHGETIEIRNAVLEASSAGGWVRYAPDGKAAAIGSAAGMAFDDLLLALRDFRYEKLSLTINGEAQGEVDVALSLHGANPDHRDGQPYNFNLNIDGRLSDMVRQSDAAYRIPARIEERLGKIAAGAEGAGSP